jgi:3-deoxy-D-manno-octulosonate 8-phosphate phosphatase (KDO 8-P phosphatase)
MNSELTEIFKKITTFVFDIDGVMTDCGVLALESGEQPRSFNVRDGYGMNRALKLGYRIAILSAQNQGGVRKRLEYLGVTDVFMGASPDGKPPIYDEFLRENGLSLDEVIFMGDDIPDYEVMIRDGVISACPADSVQEVLEVATYVSPVKGGEGAVRDLIEQVLKAQGKWLSWIQKS